MRDDRLWKDETILVFLRIRSMIFFLNVFYSFPHPSEKQPNTQTQWKTPYWKQFVFVVATGKENST